MSNVSVHSIPNIAFCLTLSVLAASTPVFAQDSQDEPPADASPGQQQGTPPASGWHRFSDSGQATPSNRSSNNPLPQQLTIKSGTFVTVRVNQLLSSDRNQGGDTFSAMLDQPLLVDGVVVARRGQTVGGRVAEAQRAGRVKGVSRLGLQLTDLTLVDGQQVRVQSQLLGLGGPKTKGRDAGAIAGSTGVGAAIGAASAGWHDRGEGAAIGAGAGALAATIGVLLTRGHATVVYPESLLTFRIEAPIIFSTERAPQAFRHVESEDYGRSYDREAPPPQPHVCRGYDCPPPPPLYAYPWPGYYPYYSPGFAFFYGPRFFRGRGFRFRR